MKKLAITIMAVVTLFAAGFAHAVGTNTLTSTTPYPDGKTYVLTTYVADESGGTVPDLTISGYRGQYICQIWTTPGSTQPTDNWDLYLKYDGGDVLKAGGENRDTANTEVTYPVIQASSNGGCAYIPGDLTLSVSGNSVNSATATILLIFSRTPW